MLTIDQAENDRDATQFTQTLDLLMLIHVSKILVVVTHMDDSTKLFNKISRYENICRKYTKIYQLYQQHWPELKMFTVPVDSLTGWNILTRDQCVVDEELRKFSGPSLFETFAKFHADGCRVTGPWRVYSVDSPGANVMRGRLVTGELKVGDFLENTSEIKREIEVISVDESSCNITKTFARPSMLHLTLNGPTVENLPRQYLYGPGVRATTNLVARMIFLKPIQPVHVSETTLQASGGSARMTKLTVLKYLDALTYETIELNTTDSDVQTHRVAVVEMQLDSLMRLELESTYPVLSKVFITQGSTIGAIGCAIRADFK